MKTKVINDITYYVIKDDNDILGNMDISEKLTEYFDDFDYIVGDISYSALRLKGFYRDSKSNNRFNKKSIKETFKSGDKIIIYLLSFIISPAFFIFLIRILSLLS